MKKKYKPSRKDSKRLKKMMERYLASRVPPYGTVLETLVERDGKTFLVNVNFGHIRVKLF